MDIINSKQPVNNKKINRGKTWSCGTQINACPLEQSIFFALSLGFDPTIGHFLRQQKGKCQKNAQGMSVLGLTGPLFFIYFL